MGWLNASPNIIQISGHSDKLSTDLLNLGPNSIYFKLLHVANADTGRLNTPLIYIYSNDEHSPRESIDLLNMRPKYITRNSLQYLNADISWLKFLPNVKIVKRVKFNLLIDELNLFMNFRSVGKYFNAISGISEPINIFLNSHALSTTFLQTRQRTYMPVIAR
jgi:hypothetical protein